MGRLTVPGLSVSSPGRLGSILVLLGVLAGIHYTLSLSNDVFHLSRDDTSLYPSTTTQQPALHDAITTAFKPSELPNELVTASPKRANATLVMLARNSDINGVTQSMRQMEDRFNHKFNYPWVFLNDEPFDDNFKHRTRLLTKANVSYGLIPKDHWVQPDWIDEEKAAEGRLDLMLHGIIYGGSVSYRNMCRFNSGFFFKHELLQPYRWYWRVEPDVSFFCDLDYDPFIFMEENKKTYGFNIALYEHARTVQTLWDAVKEFIGKNPKYVHPNNAATFLSDDGGQTFNNCHFWSNFEIADLDFWRGEAYTAFFAHLESKGGFYYERWGDAPVHSIAASLFASRDEIHFFNDIGYRHSIFQHCPHGEAHTRGKCWCDPEDNFDPQQFSCLPKYNDLFSTDVAHLHDKDAEEEKKGEENKDGTPAVFEKFNGFVSG